MSEKVFSILSDKLARKFQNTYRRQLDWERSAILDYDYVDPERKGVPNENGETDKLKGPKSIVDKANQWLTKESRLRFFLDGSRRTYRVADVNINNHYYPIIAGQVGIGLCQRENRKFSVCGEFRMKYVLALPRSLDRDSEKTDKARDTYFDNVCEYVNEKLLKSTSRFHLDKILYYSCGTDENYEDKAIARIQEYLIEQEKITILNIFQNSNLESGVWLVKDGSLEYANLTTDNDFKLSKIISNYKHVIGVSKSFNPELAILKKNKSAASMIAELKVGERTPVFKYKAPRSEGVFAVWYLRLRQTPYNRSPFDGVVKIEKILVNDEREQGLESDRVDNITSWIFNERFPVCYGKDERWANHLYPIYLTEQFVKSRYLSSDYFINLF